MIQIFSADEQTNRSIRGITRGPREPKKQWNMNPGKKLPRFKKIRKWRWIAFWIDSTFPLRTSIQKRWSFPLQMYWEKRLPPIRGFWVAVFKANQITGVSSLEISVFFLWKILATSYPWVEGHFSHSWLLPLLYPTFTTIIHKIVLDTPLHIHQLIGILTHENISF